MMVFRNTKVVFDSPKVMGVLNVTPDSFSDGGNFKTLDKAYEQACLMAEQGATFIDVGGESTRPGASEVSVQEELDRVIPVIEKIAKNVEVVISIDTSKAQVMQSSVEAGASLINDVRALTMPDALKTASHLAQSYNVPSCIMHMKGTPKTMQRAPSYTNIVSEVTDFFESRIAECVDAGIRYDQLILDPGFGFGKTLGHNYHLLRNFADFSQFDMPLLSGTSRKSMIGNLLNKPTDERLIGSIVTATIAAHSGASIIRVHDVKETVEMATIVAKTLNA